MALRVTLRTLAPVISLVLGIAAACSDGNERKVVRDAAGAGGEDPAQLGGADSGGQNAVHGGEPGTGRGGAEGGQAGAPVDAGETNGFDAWRLMNFALDERSLRDPLIWFPPARGLPRRAACPNRQLGAGGLAVRLG